MNLTAIALAMGVAVSTTAVHAQSLSLTLSGGNPGGLWSLLGAGIGLGLPQVEALFALVGFALGSVYPVAVALAGQHGAVYETRPFAG